MEDFPVHFKIETLEEREGFGRFAITPLERGFGHTLGNCLRRVLLESLEGAAITAVSISGVSHPFTTIAGMKEDVVELLLNLKQVRLRLLDEKRAKLTLSVKGEKEVTAADIKTPAGVEIVNPKLHLASLTGKKAKLEMEMVAERGRGYLLSSERETTKVGEILLDAIFSPVLRVGVKVEPTRVGRRTDLDKLIMTIFTDRTITPRQALAEAAKILVACFELFYKKKPEMHKERKQKRISKKLAAILVEELNLPVRLTNALRKSGFGTVGQLNEATREQLLEIKNVGEKSIRLIEEELAKLGVTLAKGTGEA